MVYRERPESPPGRIHGGAPQIPPLRATFLQRLSELFRAPVWKMRAERSDTLPGTPNFTCIVIGAQSSALTDIIG
jgi:hypothetical protein